MYDTTHPDVDWAIVIDQYEVFLCAKNDKGDWNHTQYSPSPLVDLVWHAHILDTQNYASTMRDGFIHHVPREPTTPREEFYRAKRYFQLYAVLPEASKVLSWIWPPPVLYTALASSVAPHFLVLDGIPRSERRLKTVIQPALGDRFDPRYHDIAMTQRQTLPQEPFCIIQWIVVPKAIAGRPQKRYKLRTSKPTQVQVFVKSLLGETVTIHVDPTTDTFGDIKRKVGPDHMQPNMMRLIYAGVQFEDTMSVYMLPPDCTLHLIARLRGC